MLSMIAQDSKEVHQLGLIGIRQLIEELLGWIYAFTIAGERNTEQLSGIYQSSFGAQSPSPEY
jgi:hypothetical protein